MWLLRSCPAQCNTSSTQRWAVNSQGRQRNAGLSAPCLAVSSLEVNAGPQARPMQGTVSKQCAVCPMGVVCPVQAPSAEHRAPSHQRRAPSAQRSSQSRTVAQQGRQFKAGPNARHRLPKAVLPNCPVPPSAEHRAPSHQRKAPSAQRRAVRSKQDRLQGRQFKAGPSVQRAAVTSTQGGLCVELSPQHRALYPSSSWGPKREERVTFSTL